MSGEARLLRARDGLTLGQLLPVEQMLIGCLRLARLAAGGDRASATAVRWRVHAGLRALAVDATPTVVLAAVEDFLALVPESADIHALECPCVGLDERRWLGWLGNPQGERGPAVLQDACPRDPGLPPGDVEIAAAQLRRALREAGWMLPPWAAPADHPQFTAHRPPALRLVVNRPRRPEMRRAPHPDPSHPRQIP